MTTPRPRTPELEDVLAQTIEYYLMDTHTILPARVTAYDAKTQKVEVQPLVQRRIAADDDEEICETLPVIGDIPVAFPRTRKYFITFPLEVGDIVTLWVSEISLDNYLSSTGKVPVDPDDFRMHDLTDAIAYPGGYPFAAPIKDISKDTMAMGRDEQGIQVHFKEDEFEIRLKGKATKHVALVEDLQSLWTQQKAYLDTHVHTSSAPSTPTSPPVASAPAWDPGINSNTVAIPENK